MCPCVSVCVCGFGQIALIICVLCARHFIYGYRIQCAQAHTQATEMDPAVITVRTSGADKFDWTVILRACKGGGHRVKIVTRMKLDCRLSNGGGGGVV